MEKLDDRIKHIRKIEKYLEQESLLVAESSIDTRLKVKKLLGEKVKILFICHRPEVWNSLKTVYEAFLSDSTFEVQILAIPNKKQLPQKGFSHEEYESEGAEEFWEGICIQGYDYRKDEWIDPRDLHPDYVFLQQPYNITRSAKYKSWMISKYAKLCYVTYVYGVFEEEALAGFHPEDFLMSTSFYFAPDDRHYKYIRQRLKEMNNFFTRSYMTGFPRFDLRLANGTKKKDRSFSALWTPRWSTVEGHSFFFEYKDLLLSYCDQHDFFSLIFRPHPQSFLEWNATGLMTEEKAVTYKNEYAKRENAWLDTNKDYLISFQAVDCFITDLTSLMVEYLITEKPIIYCHRVDGFSEIGRKLSEGYYWVRNGEELIQTLDMLSSGLDPLKEKRRALVRDVFYIPTEGAGQKIKEIIKADALK